MKKIIRHIFGLAELGFKELILHVSIYTILSSLTMLLSGLNIYQSIILLNIVYTLMIVVRMAAFSGYVAFIKPDTVGLLIYILYQYIYADPFASIFPLTLMILVLSSKILFEQILITPIYLEKKSQKIEVLKYGNRVYKESKDIYPGELVKLKPGLITPADLEIIKGKVIVREPVTGVKIIEKKNGDIVISGSKIESGYAEAVTLTSYWDSLYYQTLGVSFINSSNAVSRVTIILYIIIASIYIVFLNYNTYPGTSDIFPGSIIIYSLPLSLPIICGLYFAKISIKGCSSGLYTARYIDTVDSICSSSHIAIKLDSIVSKSEFNNYVVVSKPPYSREEITTLICISNINNISKTRLCSNISPINKRRYQVVSKFRNMVILEDRKSRVRICVGDPSNINEFSYSAGDTKVMDAIEGKEYCGIPIIAVATRYDLMGYLCLSKEFEDRLFNKVNEIRSIKDLLILVDEDTYHRLKPLITEIFGDEISKNKIIITPKNSEHPVSKHVCELLLEKNVKVVISPDKNNSRKDSAQCRVRYIAAFPHNITKNVFRDLLSSLINKRIDAVVDTGRLNDLLQTLSSSCSYRSRLLYYLLIYSFIKIFNLWLGTVSGVLWSIYLTEITSMILFSSYIVIKEQ